MKIIGAGLMRTATTTQMYALEQLGFGPCYHMRDLLANLEDGLPLWEAVAEGSPDWDRIFDGASSTVDWPSARFYGQLAERYPQAKVLLSVRPAGDWVASMRETVWGMFHGDSVLRHVNEARARLDPLWERYMQLMRSMSWDEEVGALAGGETYTDAGLGAAMERWNEEVQRSVDPERLLVWNPADGWEPLCEFLGVETPAEPLPRLNETSSFREGIIGAALETINDWWSARERPASGLHGAAVA